MASPGFPDSHTTVTSTTKTSSSIHFDPSYLRTPPGVLKGAQVIINLIGFICVEVTPAITSAISWFGFVSMTAFWVTLVLLVLYLFHLVEKLSFIPWVLGEGIYCAVWTLLYFTAAVAVAVKGSVYDSLAAGAFFGFVALALYAADAFLKYKAWKSGAPAQGERQLTTTTTSNPVSPTSPTYPAY